MTGQRGRCSTSPTVLPSGSVMNAIHSPGRLDRNAPSALIYLPVDDIDAAVAGAWGQCAEQDGAPPAPQTQKPRPPYQSPKCSR